MIDSHNRPAGDAGALPPEEEAAPDETATEAPDGETLAAEDDAPQDEAGDEDDAHADTQAQTGGDDLEDEADESDEADDGEEADADEDEDRVPAEQLTTRTGRRKGLDLSQATLVDKGEKAEAGGDDESDSSDGDDESEHGSENGENGESGKDAEEPVDYEQLGRTVEALLFASESPLNARELARAAGSRAAVIRKVIKQIIARYEESPQPWDLAEVGGGYRLVTRPEYFSALQRLKTIKPQRKLTPAALETLAYIAYSKEPVGRADIENVRGVDSGAVLRQLLERKLIKIAGRGDGMGQPLLYGVSAEFLEHFGLKSVEDLPRASEFRST